MSQAPTPSETPFWNWAATGMRISERIAFGPTQYVRDTDYLRLERDRARLIESVKYCELSTRADGQWADQAVNSFLLAALKELTC